MSIYHTYDGPIRNNKAIYITFWLVIVFQLTALKFMWDMTSVARCVNAVLFIVLLYLLFAKSLTGKYSTGIWVQYMLPGLLLTFGILLNIVLNIHQSHSLRVLAYLGFIFPWLCYLIIPYWMKRCEYPLERIWRFFYLFMLWGTTLSLIDYFLSFHGMNYLREINTSGGPFISGPFAIYWPLKDGSLYDRMQGIFLEPGTLAMWLLPAVAYAFFHKKYYSIILFIVALYLIRSLGGWISFIVLIFFMQFFVKVRHKWIYIFLIFCIMFSVILALGSIQLLEKNYYLKDKSRSVRVENIIQGVELLPNMLINRPLGLKLESTTKKMEADNKYYVGSNFMPVYSFVIGGILAFIGYLYILYYSLYSTMRALYKKHLSQIDKVVYSSLIPLFLFIIQRSSLWDSALFAFLFSPALIMRIDKCFCVNSTRATG